jgi:LemA protein
MVGTNVIIGFVVGVVVVVIIGYFVSIFNGLIRLKNNIEKSWSNINVLLKQRHDELPKLLSTVKGYMKYEKNVLTQITKARTAFMRTKDIHEKARLDNQITEALKTIFAVAENYPKLQANESFRHLQTRISGLENELADRREFYNDSVNAFNIRIQSIPDVVVAKMMSYTSKELFRVAQAEKADVKIEL